MYHTILAAHDGEGPSTAVARSAAAITERTSAELRMLRTERTIPRDVRDVGADLVVLAPHRGGAFSARLLGTRADAVVREAEVPCLVVRTPLVPPLRRIAVASDLSAAAGPALDAAIGWCRFAGGDGTYGGTRSEIRLVHVGWTVEAADDPTLEARVLRPQLERQAAEASARASGVAPPIHVDVLWEDNLADALCTWVSGHDIDLLVVGTHGAPRLRRLLVGSVASTLAWRCSCPLLVLPPLRVDADGRTAGRGGAA